MRTDGRAAIRPSPLRRCRAARRVGTPGRGPARGTRTRRGARTTLGIPNPVRISGGPTAWSRPITNPPSAAPPMLPIPPSTAAVNAAIPGLNPIVNCTCSNVRANRTPAIPASTPPIANVVTIDPVHVDPHQTGDLPILRRPPASSGPSSSSRRTTGARSSRSPRRRGRATGCVWRVTPRTVTFPASTSGFGYPYGCGPKNPRNAFCEEERGADRGDQRARAGARCGGAGTPAARGGRPSRPTPPTATSGHDQRARGRGCCSRNPLFA